MAGPASWYRWHRHGCWCGYDASRCARRGRWFVGGAFAPAGGDGSRIGVGSGWVGVGDRARAERWCAEESPRLYVCVFGCSPTRRSSAPPRATRANCSRSARQRQRGPSRQSRAGGRAPGQSRGHLIGLAGGGARRPPRASVWGGRADVADELTGRLVVSVRVWSVLDSSLANASVGVP